MSYKYVLVHETISQGPPGLVLEEPMPADHWGFTDWVEVSNLPEVPALGSTYINGVWTLWQSPSVPETASSQAAALINKGLTITSASNLIPTTTWPCDVDTQGKAVKLESRLLSGLGFPGNVSAWPWVDKAGTWHSLTVEQLTAVLTAISNFVGQCDLFAYGAPGAVLPSNEAQIP